MKKMYFILVVTAASFSLPACSLGVPQKVSQIHDANIRMMGNCVYLQDVSGSPSKESLAGPSGIEEAKRDARKKASKAGASHIVWTNIEGGKNTFVVGRAYICK